MKLVILTKQDCFRMLACLILGLIIGAVVTNIIRGHQYDQLLLDHQSLTFKVEEDQQRLKQLEKDSNGIPVIKKIVLQLISKEDNYTEKALEKEIKDLLTGLVGLPINDLDTTILREIVHDRTILIENETFHLTTETIIVDDELTFILRVHKIEQNRLVDDE